MTKKLRTLGTFVGPVGQLQQLDGGLPQVVLAEKWQSIAAEINDAIQRGQSMPAFGGRTVHLTSDPTRETLGLLQEAMHVLSKGELDFIPHEL